MDIHVSIKKEQVMVKEENMSGEQEQCRNATHFSKMNSSNGSVLLSIKEEIKDESMKDESTAEEEQYIEISPHSISKTDHSSNEKAKALTKEETRGLLELIQLHPVITSKGNNATNNRQKILVWNQITDAFNATCGAYPRTSKQLRLKWENLKKNARRRSSEIRSNRGKTNLTAVYIPRDQILDRVCKLLRSRSKARAHFENDSDSEGSGEETPVVQERSLTSGRTPATLEKGGFDESVTERPGPSANLARHRMMNSRFSGLTHTRAEQTGVIAVKFVKQLQASVPLQDHDDNVPRWAYALEERRLATEGRLVDAFVSLGATNEAILTFMQQMAATQGQLLEVLRGLLPPR